MNGPTIYRWLACRWLARGPVSPLALLTVACLFATPLACGRHTPPPGPSPPRLPVNLGQLPELRALLDSRNTAAFDSLQTRIYLAIGGYYRRLLGQLPDPPPAPQDSSAIAVHDQLERWAAAYERAFRQNTLRQMLECYDRLDARQREQWLRLEWQRREADTFYDRNAWAHSDSLARRAAEGFEALGDAYAAGRAWTRSAGAAEMRGDLERAVQQGDRALTFLERAQVPFEECRELHNIASTCRKLGRFEKAEAYLSRAIRASREVPGRYGQVLYSSARSLQAEIQIDRGRFPDAQEIYRESRRDSEQMSSPSGVAGDLRGMARLHALLGQLDRALAEYDTALVLAERNHDRTLAGDCQRDRGNVLVELGRIDEAERAYEDSLQRLASPDDSLGAGETLFGLGQLAAIRGDSRGGRAAMESALGIAVRHGRAEKVGACLIGLGEMSLTYARHGEAHDYFVRALDQARAIRHREQEQAALRALGDLEKTLGRFDSARARFDEALRIARLTGRKSAEVGLKIALAELSLDTGHPAEAATAARAAGQEARRSGAVGFALDALNLESRARLAAGDLAGARVPLEEALASPSLAVYPRRRFDLALSIARLERRAGRTAAAVLAYRRATTLLEELTDQASVAELRAGLLTGRFDVFREAVSLQIELHDLPGAFAIADRSRARSLVERLAAPGSTAAPSAGSSDQAGAGVRGELIALTRNLRELESRGASPGAVTALRDRISEMQRQYDTRLTWAGGASPAPTAAAAVEAPLLPALRELLGPDGRFVEYFQVESGWLAFIVTASAVSVVPLPAAGPATLLERRIDAFRGALHDDYIEPVPGRDWASPGAALYDDLWRPLTGSLPGHGLVYVSPEGPLAGLPFGALVMERPSTGRPRHLLETWPLALVPSAEALVLAGRSAERARRSSSREIVAVAAPRAGAQGPGSPVEHEARDVVACLPDERPLILSGSDATEDRVIAAMGRADRVHFACHAHLNLDSPRFSWLQLTPAPGSDGRLEVQEIERLRMSARLVTLSACETALDVTPRALQPAGEELTGMVRAFMGAGAAAVVASLWPVPDTEVGDLMHLFYTALAREPDQPALALNEAEVELLARSRVHDRRGHPYLTAAFILVGAGD